MSFRFNSGGDLEIAVNGEILGGVRSLRRTTVCKGEGVYQFLTDKPVAKTESRQYALDFSLHCLGVCVFENPVNSISVTDGEQTEIYTLCTVERLERVDEAEGAAEYRAVIAAGERSVLFE